LRANLTALLTEHVYLTSLATDATLRGDAPAFDAYAGSLNGPANSNSVDLVAAVTSAYGADGGKVFDALWRSDSHIPALFAYTQALAKGDQAGRDKAVSDLLAYAKTFGITMHQLNGFLAGRTIEDAVQVDVTTLETMIAAQKNGDRPKVYSTLREAYQHMEDLATTLTVATARKFPHRFDGDATSPAAELRAEMTSLLREHALLSWSAMSATLAGVQPEAQAALAALNGVGTSNTADLVDAVRSAYGPEGGRAFNLLWRSDGHIPALIAYAQALAKGDQAGQDKAVSDLQAYAKTFGITMNELNGYLDPDAVEQATNVDITSQKTVLDTLKAVVASGKPQDAPKITAALREAVKHMADTADLLVDATVKKFPDRF
jgi:hypothetical protein